MDRSSHRLVHFRNRRRSSHVLGAAVICRQDPYCSLLNYFQQIALGNIFAMSGRSAYVRKKITETKKGDGLTTPDLYPVCELPVPSSASIRSPGSGYDGGLRTGDWGNESDGLSPVLSSGRQSADVFKTEAVSRPLDDFAYARARKPTIRTDDMTGISKSGVRSAYDKKTDDIRRGLSKAFGFGGRKAKREAAEKMEYETESTGRPGTSRTDGTAHEKGSIHRMPLPPQIYELPGDSTGSHSPHPKAWLPDIPTGFAIRRWIGSGRPVQRWNKLRKDPEIWDTNGDALVYLGPQGQTPRLEPSMRLSSHIIEATDSRYLVTMLREGAIEEFPPSPRGVQSAQGLDQHAVPVSASQNQPRKPTSQSHRLHAGGQPTPPRSDDSYVGVDGQLSYELFFPPPSNASKTDRIRHQITTRNIFALLCRVSLVGLSLHQALSDLHERLDQYLPQTPGDNLLTIMSYLCARGIDDVRNDAESAIGLLAWAEDSKVRWEEAWREAFVHAAGFFTISRGRSTIESCVDYKKLSPITRALLERASLEIHLRVQAAEERLAAFSFGDMWPSSISRVPTLSGATLTSLAKETADRVQRFFLNHYQNFYGRWPPPPLPEANVYSNRGEAVDEPIWLTRTVTQALQKDMGALYDYLVNRDIIWDMSETRPSRKWLMVSESGNRAFEADTGDLPMTDILIEFDNRNRFPHIPHPYPLVPDSIPARSFRLASPSQPPTLTGSGRKILRGMISVDGELASAPLTPRPTAAERRVQLAYTESTNIYVLGSDFVQSDLIDAFVTFEKTDRVNEIDPSLARRVRWVVIYGILQTLASVSVDAPSVRYRDDVPYHLSPQLQGARIPPWSKKAGHAGASYMEAAHELSHCWVTSLMWTASASSASDDDGTDDDLGAPTPRLPPLTIDQARLNLGFAPPPPPPQSTRSRSSSATNTTPSQTSHSLAPPPTTTATTASTDCTNSETTSSPMSTSRTTTPPMARLSARGSKVARGYSRRSMGGPRKTAPLSATGGSSRSHTPPRLRVAEGGDEWSAVPRGETAFERARKGTAGSAPAPRSEVSVASTFGGARRKRSYSTGGKAVMGGQVALALTPAGHSELMEPSPITPESVGFPLDEYEDLDELDDADAERLGSGSGMAGEMYLEGLRLHRRNGAKTGPVIRDFDALSLTESLL